MQWAFVCVTDGHVPVLPSLAKGVSTASSRLRERKVDHLEILQRHSLLVLLQKAHKAYRSTHEQDCAPIRLYVNLYKSLVVTTLVSRETRRKLILRAVLRGKKTSSSANNYGVYEFIRQAPSQASSERPISHPSSSQCFCLPSMSTFREHPDE